MIFETLDTSGHEQVVFCSNPDAGLKAIIAIHSTVLGPALGGVRMRSYVDTQAALTDALRLSRTMTYKNALAGLNVGGGKAILIGDPATDKFWFCGLPSQPGKPYCEAHVSVAFQPMSSRRDRRR